MNVWVALGLAMLCIAAHAGNGDPQAGGKRAEAGGDDTSAAIASEYHIYKGNTHAHTIFTASHGDHLISTKKAGEGKPESGLQIDPQGVQRPAKGMVRKSNWQMFQGEPADHFARAKTNGYDFYITTDHSQDEPFAPTSATNGAWLKAKAQAIAATDTHFVALTGYEHSENNGPGGKGHLNVINTEEYLNALAPGVDLPRLYEWLKHARSNGEGPIVASFNHPARNGYNDWGHRDPKITEIITLLEVVNGNSHIHYDGFIRALDKGWKVSPVCGLDNHGFWGILHHTSVTCVLATNLTKAAILDALRQRRTYATMDSDLQCRYTVNGKIMGTTLEPTNQFAFDVSIREAGPNNPNQKITKVEIVKDGGVMVDTYHPKPTVSVHWQPQVSDSTNKYFFIRVWSQGGGGSKDAKPNQPVAWLAPVWTGR